MNTHTTSPQVGGVQRKPFRVSIFKKLPFLSAWFITMFLLFALQPNQLWVLLAISWIGLSVSIFSFRPVTYLLLGFFGLLAELALIYFYVPTLSALAFSKIYLGFYSSSLFLSFFLYYLYASQDEVKSLRNKLVQKTLSQAETASALEKSRQSFHNIVLRQSEGLIVLSHGFIVHFVNPVVETFLGRRADTLLGEPFPFAIQLGSSQEILIHRFTGELGTGELRIVETEWEGESALLASIHDISDRKETEKQIQHNALHDDLTSLPNRIMFLEQLQKLIDKQKRQMITGFAVLFLDMDRFKNVNDSLGHALGDLLLLELSKRLQECLRSCDLVARVQHKKKTSEQPLVEQDLNTIARFGGDEFALLLSEIGSPRDATRVAERILKVLSRPFLLEGHELYASVSIGISLSSPELVLEPGDYLRNADIAMYRAKEEGRSRYVLFDDLMHEEVLHVLQLENDLRRSLDNGDFELYYQPIVSLDTGRLISFEALLRWQHPDKGLIMPGDFISLAEDTGLIVPLGWWVLEEACRQMKLWRTELNCDPELTISVNLSAKQFAQVDLAKRVLEIIDKSGLDHGGLKLEITESAIVEQIGSVAAMLEELQSHQVQIHMDDFGTGYSSLSYLHRFPIDVLKIDRMFVSRMTQAENQIEIVKAIVSLAHNLGMKVVAEGVETEEQLRALRDFNCDFAQGFLLSLPLTSSEATKLIQSSHITQASSSTHFITLPS